MMNRHTNPQTDVLPVPFLGVGEAMLTWVRADSLSKVLSKRLITLQGEYIQGSGGDDCAMSQMVGELIQRFEAEIKVVGHVRTACTRYYTLMAMTDIPPYAAAVPALHQHLNCWLYMWNEHQRHRAGVLAAKTDTKGKGKETSVSKDEDEDKDEDKDKLAPNPMLQHLKTWLAELDKLPPYPEHFPMDPSSKAAEQVEFKRSEFPVYKPEGYSGFSRTATDVKKRQQAQALNIFEYRTPARMEADERRRRRPEGAPTPGWASGPDGKWLMEEDVARDKAAKEAEAKARKEGEKK